MAKRGFVRCDRRQTHCLTDPLIASRPDKFLRDHWRAVRAPLRSTFASRLTNLEAQFSVKVGSTICGTSVRDHWRAVRAPLRSTFASRLTNLEAQFSVKVGSTICGTSVRDHWRAVRAPLRSTSASRLTNFEATALSI